MAIAIEELRKLQFGKETTKGTSVPATRQLQGDWSIDEQIDWYFTPYPRGVRAPTGNGVKLRQGVALTYTSELTAEELIVFAGSGLLLPTGGNPATVDVSARLWTFTPGLTGAPTVDSFTYEMIETDGTTNHYAQEFAYGLTSSFKIDLAYNQVAKFSAKIFGQAAVSSTPTAGLSPYANREILASNGTSVFIDVATGSTFPLASPTQITGTFRSASVEYMTGLAEKYNLDGRANNDMTEHRFGQVRATIDMVMDLEAQAATMWGRYRAGTQLFVRLLTNGSLAGNTTALKFVRQDLVIRLTANPAVSSDGSLRTVSFKGETVYWDLAAKELILAVQNKEAAY